MLHGDIRLATGRWMEKAVISARNHCAIDATRLTMTRLEGPSRSLKRRVFNLR